MAHRAIISRDLATVEVRPVAAPADLPAAAVDPSASLWSCLDHALTGDPVPGLLKLKERLEQWEAEAGTQVSLGSSYLFDIARERAIKSPRDVPPTPATAAAAAAVEADVNDAERARKRDVLLRYIVAARGRLLEPNTPGGNVAAAIELLSNEAANQHAKNRAAYESFCSAVVKAPPEAPRPASDDADHRWVLQLIKQCCRLLEVPDDPAHCHHCKCAVDKAAGHHLGSAATCRRCHICYCRSCLRKVYDQTLAQMSAPDWVCPRCVGKCWCTECVKLGRVVQLKRCFGVASESKALNLTETHWFDKV